MQVRNFYHCAECGREWTEYQAIFEANVKEQAAGGQGTTKTYRCFSPGMPRVTNGYGEIEFVVTPKTTHILVDHIYDNRRVFTDANSLFHNRRLNLQVPANFF